MQRDRRMQDVPSVARTRVHRLRGTLPATALLILMAACRGPVGVMDGPGPPPPGAVVDTLGPVAIVGATVLPMTDPLARLEDHTVLTRGGRIVAVGPRSAIDVPADALVVDGRGRFVLPGLADMHTHIATETATSAGPGELLLYAANGVTTVLNQGDFGGPLPDWADQVRAGELLGPTLYVARYARGSEDGAPASVQVEGAAGARAYAARAADEGYHFIKIYNYTGAAAVRAFLAEAEDGGLPVIGHIPQTLSAVETLTSGLRMVGHAGFGGLLTSDLAWPARSEAGLDSAIALAAANGVWVNATLAVEDAVSRVWGGDERAMDAVFEQEGVAYAHPSTLALWDRKMRRQRLYNPPGSAPGGRDADMAIIRTLVRDLRDAGVPLLIGSDSPTVLLMAGFSIHRELELFRGLGLSPAEVLTIATRDAGRFIDETLQVDDPFGTVEVGKRADLLVLSGDPTLELGALRRRVGVMLRGRWVSEGRFLELLQELTPGG